MAYDAKERNLKDGQITVKDSGANSVVVVLDNGGLSFTRPLMAKMVSDRGTLDHWRGAPDEPIDLSFEMAYSTLYSDTDTDETATPYEALTQENAASGWATTSGTDVYTVTLEFLVNNPVTGKKDEKITFTQVHLDSVDLTEGEDGDTLAVTARAISMSIERVT